jgi:hypothetical protein
VRAHFRREQERATGDGFVSPDAEGEYRAKLEQFEREEGKLAAVYWSTRNASAVAMSIGQPHARHNPITETEIEVLRPRRVRRPLALTRPTMLPSTQLYGVGTPER